MPQKASCVLKLLNPDLCCQKIPAEIAAFIPTSLSLHFHTPQLIDGLHQIRIHGPWGILCDELDPLAMAAELHQALGELMKNPSGPNYSGEKFCQKIFEISITRSALKFCRLDKFNFA